MRLKRGSALNVMIRFIRYCCGSIVAPILSGVEGWVGENYEGDRIDSIDKV
jgi:hypothetical protein